MIRYHYILNQRLKNRADLFVDKSPSDQHPTEMMVTKIAQSTEWK